jgi:ribosomal protein S2
LPGFISFLIRIFYITKSKFEEILHNQNIKDENSYFNSVFNRFLLFWRVVIFFKCFKKTSNLPDCLIFLNPDNSQSQLNDFSGVRLPIISVTDTVSNIFRITYPIPSNDDSIILLLFYFMLFLNACEASISNRYTNFI